MAVKPCLRCRAVTGSFYCIRNLKHDFLAIDACNDCREVLQHNIAVFLGNIISFPVFTLQQDRQKAGNRIRNIGIAVISGSGGLQYDNFAGYAFFDKLADRFRVRHEHGGAI